MRNKQFLSSYLLLTFIGVYMSDRGNLRRLAATSTHVLQKAEVGTPRNDDCDDDDDGGTEGW